MFVRSQAPQVSGAREATRSLERSVVEPSIAPAPSPKEHRYAPGLDGIRGVAVAAIVAYHLGFMDGGLLSVSVFFTLSGYLITSILLTGYRKSGTIDLKGFWLRRARRLLPALLLLLVVVLLAAAITRPGKLAAYAGQAFSASIYIANWATIGRGDTYFNRFSGPGPFDHLWSLAIEEQFYAVWPLLLFGLLIAGRRWSRKRASDAAPRAPIAAMVVTFVLAVASALTMAFRYVPNALNNTRAYEGTDTRAAPILVGALAAMLLPLGHIGEGGRVRRILLEVIGAVACVLVVTVVVATDEYAPFLYRGGESLVSFATAALVLAAAHPSTLVGKAFGVAPLRWFGARTYGVYLWHLPVIAFMPASMLEGRPLARGALQLALIMGLAALSWTLLEDPIRRNGVVATFTRRARGLGADLRPRVGLRWAGVMVLACIATGALAAWPLLSHASASEVDFEELTAELTAEAPDPQPSGLPPAPSGRRDDSLGATATTAATATAKLKERSLTSCTHLVHVGDSTSLGLMSKKYLPMPEDRLDAQYRAVGVELFVAEISGGRSIVEKFKEYPNAWEVVAARGGFKGCWVFALGIGDAANVTGNFTELSRRIDTMMIGAAGAPVLWTTTKTLLDKGPYRNSYMESWNSALVQACTRHPNMRVYDWASEVQDGWYLDDKIHPNDPGSKERAARLAGALAIAFPKDRLPAAQCVVGSTP